MENEIQSQTEYLKLTLSTMMQTTKNSPGVVAHIYNLSTQEAEQDNLEYEANMSYIARLTRKQTKNTQKKAEEIYPLPKKGVF
jgi:hypothetical protein